MINFKRKLFYVLVLFLLTSCITYDAYENLTETESIEKLSNPTYSEIIIVNKGYGGYEYEPNYSLHFTLEELEKGVEVKVNSWEFFHIITYIWYKNIEGEWISFSSLQYDSNLINF